ncbi:hypothetical protein Barb4_05098 [Bacteroidales bacterium Barb4]|nr:hypothetical protein Barb4_05098 [Bacteroidales bacterium Barb4]
MQRSGMWGYGKGDTVASCKDAGFQPSFCPSDRFFFP